MGIVAENARGAIIDDNELEGIAVYGVMVRGSSNTLVQANRRLIQNIQSADQMRA